MSHPYDEVIRAFAEGHFVEGFPDAESVVVEQPAMDHQLDLAVFNTSSALEPENVNVRVKVKLRNLILGT